LAPRIYRLILERDESGAWIARIPEVPGFHTHGRTIGQVRRRAHEALGLWVDDAGDVVFDEQIHLPRHARQALQRSRALRERAERDRAEARSAAADAASVLVRELELGMRDAAELLGVSHQRVQQLLRGSAAQLS
jgi:predicted RNase H-like HicB family nuclease